MKYLIICSILLPRNTSFDAWITKNGVCRAHLDLGLRARLPSTEPSPSDTLSSPCIMSRSLPLQPKHTKDIGQPVTNPSGSLAQREGREQESVHSRSLVGHNVYFSTSLICSAPAVALGAGRELVGGGQLQVIVVVGVGLDGLGRAAALPLREHGRGRVHATVIQDTGGLDRLYKGRGEGESEGVKGEASCGGVLDVRRTLA